MKEKLENSLKAQVRDLGLAQYLLWQKELPAGFNWPAIKLSYAAHLTGQALDLPLELDQLKELERNFRLEISGQRYPVSDCGAINTLLAEAGSDLRLMSGFFGRYKFYLLAQAEERQVAGYTVYQLKEEVAVTPGCHILMAALVSGKTVFLREASARFLYQHKWGPALSAKFSPEQIIQAFMENLLEHELNHHCLADYVEDQELLGLAQASQVLGTNILTHLGEIFTDWRPGKNTTSPLVKIFKDQDLLRLAIYVSDNWFYETGFPEQHIFTSLNLAPLLRHVNRGTSIRRRSLSRRSRIETTDVYSVPDARIETTDCYSATDFNWDALIKEATDQTNGSLLNVYQDFLLNTAGQVKKIIEEAKYTLVDRPISFHTIKTYADNDIKARNPGVTGLEYQVTFWSSVFNYVRKFAPESHQQILSLLAQAEQTLAEQVNAKFPRSAQTLRQTIETKAAEIFGETVNV